MGIDVARFPSRSVVKGFSFFFFPRGYFWKQARGSTWYDVVEGWEGIIVQFGCFLGIFVSMIQFFGHVPGIVLGFLTLFFFLHGFIAISVRHGPAIFLFVVFMIAASFMMIGSWIFTFWFAWWAYESNTTEWQVIMAFYMILTPRCVLHCLLLARVAMDALRQNNFPIVPLFVKRKKILEASFIKKRKPRSMDKFVRLEEPVGEDGAIAEIEGDVPIADDGGQPLSTGPVEELAMEASAPAAGTVGDDKALPLLE